ncbi:MULTISPECIES: hypothetical protein [unclassified Fusibacter]|uniref:hypothetical protein n=1 Tax=unclassified Fusibacter TaxID=2624464 RepID=UPI00101294BB|nr:MULTISPECIES: hypothetical protein [unclassified Fusibacter]MCK8059686.1 hypothetical protein [Fusibacter sp. A2]NPE21487.1 hypothetical protein [Fusibacter sp. A1]RXV61898.1 hypothetical protein DWB64_06570 [Fusibacter sp. A1]
MKVIKFAINEAYYTRFQDICFDEDITIKKKLNVLLAKDTDPSDFTDYFPATSEAEFKKVTLKLNDELYKSIMKNCGRYDLRSSRYVPYLIYKFLYEKDNGLA